MPSFLSLFIAIGLFLFVSNYFITEKSFGQKLFPTALGFGGGMLGGGILGWVVGGFGIVAMGTGVGFGAVGAVAIGIVAGAVFGGLTGASFSFLMLLKNPSNFNVEWGGILAVAILTSAIFFALRWLIKKIPSFQVSPPPPPS